MSREIDIVKFAAFGATVDPDVQKALFGTEPIHRRVELLGLQLAILKPGDFNEEEQEFFEDVPGIDYLPILNDRQTTLAIARDIRAQVLDQC